VYDGRLVYGLYSTCSGDGYPLPVCVRRLVVVATWWQMGFTSDRHLSEACVRWSFSSGGHPLAACVRWSLVAVPIRWQLVCDGL
jgi:hypothetical protein